MNIAVRCIGCYLICSPVSPKIGTSVHFVLASLDYVHRHHQQLGLFSYDSVLADRLLALEPGIQPVCPGQLLALVRWVSTTEQR